MCDQMEVEYCYVIMIGIIISWVSTMFIILRYNEESLWATD